MTASRNQKKEAMLSKVSERIVPGMAWPVFAPASTLFRMIKVGSFINVQGSLQFAALQNVCSTSAPAPPPPPPTLLPLCLYKQGHG